MKEVVIHFAPWENLEERDEKLFNTYVQHMPLEIKRFIFHYDGERWVDDFSHPPASDDIYLKAEEVSFGFIPEIY